MDTAKPRNGGRWTESRFNQFIKGGLRALTRKWGPTYDAVEAAYAGRKYDETTKRESNRYKCAMCGDLFKREFVQVDHIEPVSDPTLNREDKKVDWNVVVNRMFCEQENLQVLCEQCHKHKTLMETKTRKEVRKKNASK